MNNLDNKNSQPKVLIIDDNEVIRRLAETLLSKKGFRVESAENGKSGSELARSCEPDVILLDVMMPDMDGYQVCESLKSDFKTMNIPVIMVTSRTEAVDKIKGLELGAADYITKPFDHSELQARVATQIKLKNLWDELQEKNRILEELIKKDGLTNLYNHRHFHERISEEFSRALRYKTSLNCVLIDIDHFKKINDVYGHQAGDEILKSLADIFLDLIRRVDIAARYGGEEFALIVPETSLEGAFSMAERIRNKIESSVFNFSGTEIKATVSMGVSAIQSSPANYTELIRFADEALYDAKAGGRNRVMVYKKS